MRLHLSIAAILVGTACSLSAPSAILTSPDDLPSLRAADSAWKQASLSRNVDRMVGFYTSNAIADLGLGEPSRGAAAIRELWAAAYADTAYRLDWTNQRAEVADTTTVLSAKIADAHVRVYGQAAVITGVMIQMVAGARPFPRQYRWTDTWIRGTDGRWRCVASQSMVLAARPETRSH